MKRLGIVCLTIVVFLAGCTAQPVPVSDADRTADEGPLVVFAAASLQETLEQIGVLYAHAAGQDVEFNFDSSGTLKTQITEGARCDLFISAAQRQMNELEEAGYLNAASRRNLLENQVVLAVPKGNPAELGGFEDLVRRLRAGGILLAIGNADVPVGQYTAEIFTYFGLDGEELGARGVLSYGNNVKEVVAQIEAGSVDAGIVYATDAHGAELETVSQATPEMCGQVLYPGAVLAQSAYAQQAEDFLHYLSGPEAERIFRQAGFVPVSA